MAESSSPKIVSKATKKVKSTDDSVVKKSNKSKSKKSVDAVKKMLSINVENTAPALKQKVQKTPQTRKVINKVKRQWKSTADKTPVTADRSSAKRLSSIENIKAPPSKYMMAAVIREVEEKMATKSKGFAKPSPSRPQQLALEEKPKNHPRRAPGLKNLIAGAKGGQSIAKTAKPKVPSKPTYARSAAEKIGGGLQRTAAAAETKRANPVDPVESVNAQTQT